MFRPTKTRGGMRFAVENTETGEVTVLRPGLVVSLGGHSAHPLARRSPETRPPARRDRFHPASARCDGYGRGRCRPGIFVAGTAIAPKDTRRAWPRGSQRRCGRSSRRKKQRRQGRDPGEGRDCYALVGRCSRRIWFIDQTLLPTIVRY